MGTFSKILPYANAILMVIKEVSKAIASMFGIKLTDFNSGIATQEGIYDGIADSADGANKAVKELKRQTLGFDEIHNINEDKDSDISGVSGGIDQRLLDAISGYDNGMDKVRMKATEIRDRIMEWLGFTKKINPLTGETYFEYQGIQKTLKNMWNSFKGLSTQGKILVGLGLVTGAVKLWNAGKNLVSVFGNSGLWKVTKNLLSPMKSLYGALDDVNFANKSLTKGLAEGITSWSQSLTMADKFKVSLVGILGLATSMSGMSSAMRNVSNEGWNLNNSLQAVASGLGGIASGAYIGSIFGPWGTVIGGATGALFGLISAINGYDTASEKMIKKSEANLEISKQYLQNYYDTKKAIEESMNGELAQEEYYERLLSELDGLVDANGKVKKGYEDRVNFILNQLNSACGTEYSIINGTIDGYNDLSKSIKDVIANKKAEIMLDAEKKNYTNAIEKQGEAWKKYNNAIKENNEANEKANELIDKQMKAEALLRQGKIDNLKYTSELTKGTYEGGEAYQAIKNDLEAYNKTIENNEKDIKNYRKTFEECTDDIIFYEDLQTAVLSNDVDKQNKLIEDRLSTIKTANGEEKLSYSEKLQFYDDIAKRKLKILQENGVAVSDEMIEQSKTQKQIVIDELVDISDTVDNLSGNVIKGWATLATQSEEKFLENFEKLNPDIQNKIINKMYEKGYSISDELQRGINQINPTIKVNADISQAQSKISELTNKISNQVNNTLKVFGFNIKTNADGGIYSNGIWKNIPQYANGGIPSHGSMFVAGENGAEMVGHINGRTEVLNQSQIASAIYSAVVNAMSQFSGQMGEIDVHVHTDEGTVIDRIERRTKQTGVFPFTIPTT